MILKTINNPRIARQTRQVHEVNVPPLCPRTANPIEGSTLTISYIPQELMLEVYSLNEYIASFIGSSLVRDLEAFAQTAAKDCGAVLGVPVTVTGKFVLNIGQVLICECEG